MTNPSRNGRRTRPLAEYRERERQERAEVIAEFDAGDTEATFAGYGS
jgi:hypothetical protein